MEHVPYQNIHQDLINKCRKGDQKAQLQIYKLYSQAMYNVSFRISGDYFVAEEVMQDAFMKAFAKIKTYKGEVSFGAWLKKIVVNCALDELKKRKTVLVSFEEANTLAMIEDNSKGGEEIISYKIQRIKKAIDKLPEGYKLVINLYLIEGYDHDEISQILEISASTSRSQFIRAKRRLLQILKEGK